MEGTVPRVGLPMQSQTRGINRFGRGATWAVWVVITTEDQATTVSGSAITYCYAAATVSLRA